jgi:hypothetical protein
MSLPERTAFGYIRARIMARHSRRLSPEQWQELENCRGLESFLQLARQSSLDAWVRHFAPGDEPQRWERSLRRDWQTSLEQFLGWTPPRWSPCLAWTSLLPQLPAIAGLLNSAPGPAWVGDDDLLGPLDTRDRQAFRESLVKRGWQALLQYWNDAEPLSAWWRAWQDAWPAGTHARLERLEPGRVLLLHPDGLQREKLDQFLSRILRDQHPDILPVLAHLGLLALDLGRLRANLLHRRVRILAMRTSG